MSTRRWVKKTSRTWAMCSNCKVWKHLDQFPPCHDKRNGKSSWCRDCKRRSSRDSKRRKQLYAAFMRLGLPIPVEQKGTSS